MTAPALSPTARRIFQAFVVVGIIAFGSGIVASPFRAFSSLLVSAYYFLTIALGSAVFLALMYLSRAGWATALKRVPEALTTWLPLGALTLLCVLPGVSVLYPWGQAAGHGAGHPLPADKQAFLSIGPFAMRMVVILVLWIAFAWAIRHNSLRQDADRTVALTNRNVALSAVFLVVTALSLSLASFDWMMSLEPHWSSTIYALYNIGGMLVGATAAITVFVIGLRKVGYLEGVTDEHLHDLGRLLFGFSTLWAYLWLSQYLLIWYANIPEETSWYLTRTRGGWTFLFWLNLILGWALPFVVLLPRPAKRSEATLLRVSTTLLVARWLDLYLLATPGGSPEHAGIGFIEVGTFLGLLGLFALVVAMALKAAPLVPEGDPYLEESLHHRT